MIISALNVRETQIPLKERFKTAIRETDVIDAIEIELCTDAQQSFRGYATATPAITGDSVTSIVEYISRSLRPVMVGASVDSGDQIDLLIDEVQLGVQASSSAVAGIDQALHSLRAYHFDSAVSHARVRTSVTLSAGSTEDMIAAAERRLALGFTVIKAKLGRDPDGDAQRVIELARFLGGRATFWVDANQGWTFDQTLKIMEVAEAADALPGLLEQPVPAAELHALCALSARLSVPVAADEGARYLESIDRIADLGGVAMINVKFMKFGGLTGSAQAVAKARYHGMGVLVGSMMEHPASVAQAIQFAANLSEEVHDLDAAWWATDSTPVSYESGFATVCS